MNNGKGGGVNGQGKNNVKIVECPRDAWQGLPGQIPAEVKASLFALVG